MYIVVSCTCLHLISRTLDGQTIPFTSLSVGTREQLGILTRLAVAQIVSAQGGVPLIIDDALGFSDPARLASMGAAIAHAGENTQIQHAKKGAGYIYRKMYPAPFLAKNVSGPFSRSNQSFRQESDRVSLRWRQPGNHGRLVHVPWSVNPHGSVSRSPR